MTRVTGLAVLVLSLSAFTLWTQPAAPPVLARAVPGTHAYFDTLVARPDHWKSYSLRDQAQLDYPSNGGFAHSNKRPLAVTYAPEADPDPRRQDAAKVTVLAGSNNLRNQLRVPVENGEEAFLITWDVWWGREFDRRKTSFDTYKAFQLSSGRTRIWTEVRSRFKLAQSHFPDAIALVDVRTYRNSADHKHSVVESPSGKVNYGSDSLGKQLQNFPIAPEKWTRYWIHVKPRRGDGWWDFSMWMADEDRDPVQLFDRVGVRPADAAGWDKFWVEYNTSDEFAGEGRGPLTSYVRNIVILRDPSNPISILKRPHPAILPPAADQPAP